ncbi:Hypothetical predicted protein [Mytilus galloprovincialis]|uniref:Uncharacterized protein n=1 Tax=Mytilus galloprovincialis TaxID=29158 RepID=A0A8B6GQP9_MYTGA|nr:Hypothetical predicted protein [Mytilus galloprovincialis]
MDDFFNRSFSDSDSDDNPIYVARDPRKDKHFDRKQELLWNCKGKAGKVGQGKKPLVIAVIGPPGCGKSSFLNTIFAAFSHDCWTEHAKYGEFGRRDKQVTRRLKSFQKKVYYTDKDEYLLPTFLDMTGFEDENTPLNKELLRIVFCGKLGEDEELNEVRNFGELYGVNAVREKYFGENYFGIYKKQDSKFSNPFWKYLDFSVILNREEYLRVNRIIVVCSANPHQQLPESLFEAVSDITNRERDITLYGVLTQADKYKSRDQRVLKREREFMRALGIPKNRFARIKNYCPDIDPNMTYEDTIIPSLDVPVLRLMRQLLTAEPTDQDYEHRQTKNGKCVPNLSNPCVALIAAAVIVALVLFVLFVLFKLCVLFLRI